MSHSIRRFAASDEAAMLAFTNSLPEHDLLFLSRDVQHPRVVEAWAAAIGEGTIDSLVAEDDGQIVGTAALVRDPLGWSPHVGEVRLLVSPDRRGAGLGRDLLEAIFAIAHAHGTTHATHPLAGHRPTDHRWAEAGKKFPAKRIKVRWRLRRRIANSAYAGTASSHRAAADPAQARDCVENLVRLD